MEGTLPQTKKHPKSLALPKIRVEGWRLRQWQTAARMLSDKSGSSRRLSFSEFIRRALDDAAEQVFEVLGEPKEADLYPDGAPHALAEKDPDPPGDYD
jgi:hypothetical protein